MHCVSSYPTKLEDINLQNIAELKRFKIEVGFSDHTAELKQQFRPFFLSKSYRKTFIPLKGSSKSADYPLSINFKQMKSLRKK